MRIDRKASKKMIKIVSFIAVFGLVSIGNGIMVSLKLQDGIKSNDFENQYKFYKRRMKYIEMLNEIDESHFEQNLMLLYDNGYLKILGNLYIINDLYIVTNKDSGTNYIVSYKKPNIDILSGLTIEDIKERQIVLFKNSSLFYQLYKLSETSVSEGQSTMDLTNVDSKKIAELVSSYDGGFHSNTPEMYCLNKIKQKD